MSEPRFSSESDKHALNRIYQAVTAATDQVAKGPVTLLVWGLAVMVITQIYQGDTGVLTALAAASPVLARLINTLGGNILADIVMQVKSDKRLPPEQIRTLLFDALNESKLNEVLTEAEFYRAVRILEDRDEKRHQELKMLLLDILTQNRLAAVASRFAPTSTAISSYILGDLVIGDKVMGDKISIHQPPQPIYPIDNLLPDNPHFTGREDQLAALLKGNNQTTIIQAISGLGGVGKSQLMLHFAHQQRQHYDIIWWIRVDESLEEDLALLGQQLYLAFDNSDRESNVQHVRSWLNTCSKRWLLLFDNADETEPRRLRQYLPTNKLGRVLITSRRADWHGIGSLLRLEVFTSVEAEAFLARRLGSEQSLNNEISPLATLSAELGYLPLALELAAAYMIQNGLSVADYLLIYQAQRHDLWQITPAPFDYDKTMVTVWELNFAKIQATPGATELLNLCCFLAPDEIPLDILIAHANTLPEKLQSVLLDPLKGNAARNALTYYSLVNHDKDTRHLAVHKLVQDTARDRMGVELANSWAAAAVALLSEAYDFDEYNMVTWPGAAQLLPHLTNVIALADQCGLDSNQVANLNTHAGFYLHHVGDYESALPFYERALTIREKDLGPDHPDTAIGLRNLAETLRAMGEYETAQPLVERALDIHEKALGPNHPDTATDLTNLAEILRAMGEYETAQPLVERALGIHEKALGPNHPETATDLTNLALLMKAAGEYEAAHSLHERALAICEKALGPDHPQTAISLNNLAFLLYTMGDYESARPLYERALAIKEVMLSPEHPGTATSLNNLANLFYAMNNHDLALQFYQRTLAIREKTLGPYHPHTAQSLNNLAQLLKAMGDYESALPLYERALAIDEKVLGPDHPDTAIDLNNLAGLHYSRGNYVVAQLLYERALAITEKALGREHPTTAIRLNNLARLMDKIGDHHAARSLYERALAIAEAKLGPSHPHTQIFRRNLQRME